MPKRVAHIIKIQSKKIPWPGQPGSFRVSYWYWCGRFEQCIEEIHALTPEESAEREKFISDQESNPWPVCKKCRQRKDRMSSRNAVETAIDESKKGDAKWE